MKEREIKDSGIPWIGEIPKDWEIKPLKFLSNIIMGQSPNGDEIKTEGEIPFMQGNTEFGLIHPSTSTYCDSCNKHSRIGDILMSVRAPVGEMNMADKIYGIGRGLCSIKPMNIFPKFLWQYLLKSKKDFSVFSNGSTFDAVTVSTLNNFPICYPTLQEQKTIADFLDRKCGEIDDLVSLQDKMIEELKAYKQSIITETVTKGLNPNVPLKDSGIEWIGQIPQHWKIVRLRNLCDIQTGDKDTIMRVEDGIYPFFVRSPKVERINEYSFDTEAILMAGDGVGAGKVFHYYKGKFGCHQRVYCFFNFTNKIVPIYLLYYLSHKFKELFVGLSAKSTVDSVRLPMLKDFTVMIPSLSEQQEIADYLDRKCSEIDSLIELKQQKIEELKDYKKSIIYEYVTGKKEIY